MIGYKRLCLKKYTKYVANTMPFRIQLAYRPKSLCVMKIHFSKNKNRLFSPFSATWSQLVLENFKRRLNSDISRQFHQR